MYYTIVEVLNFILKYSLSYTMHIIKGGRLNEIRDDGLRNSAIAYIEYNITYNY